MFTVLLCIQIMRKIMILLARLCVIQQPNKTFVSYLGFALMQNGNIFEMVYFNRDHEGKKFLILCNCSVLLLHLVT